MEWRDIKDYEGYYQVSDTKGEKSPLNSEEEDNGE